MSYNENENPDLQKVVEKDNPMKGWLVSYVGDKFKPESDEVTVELIIEAMAQAIGALNLYLKPRECDDELFYLAGVDATRFRKIVEPGDCLHMKCTQIKARQNLVKFDARSFVDDVLVCSAELILVREKSA